MTVRVGCVYLVGAGPGHRDLITVRGLKLLQRADVVLYDRLVLDTLLMEASPLAELIDVGKSAIGESSKQQAINALLVAHARAGRMVVRLKGGDPFLFGRGWEELEACDAEGIPCEVIPGVSSALAAPAAAGIPVTCRGVASSVAITAAPALTDANAQALTHVDTNVFLMGVATMAMVAARLIANGHAPTTPCAVIERATMPGQRVVRATLACVGQRISEARIESPAVLVVGQVAALQRTGNQLLSRLATTSEMSNTGTSFPAPVTPSLIMVMQNGHATAI